MGERLTTTGALSIASIVAVLAVACVKKDMPQERHLADCTTNHLRFLMVVRERPPYHLLLAMPRTAPFDSGGNLALTHWRPKFRGEAVLTGVSGKTLRLPLDSDEAESCNWLDRDHGIEAFILGSVPLREDEVYEVQITFSEAPPSGSSVWLAGMVREALTR